MTPSSSTRAGITTGSVYSFDEIYEAIDPDMLDEEILRIHQCVNEMDNVLSEMDEREPGTFCEMVEELAMFIEGKCPEED